MHQAHLGKYFPVKDFYNSKEIVIRFCPAEKMWWDVLTKPLQGQKFIDMQAFLQNCATDYDNDVEMKKLVKPQNIASSQECVGEHTKSIGKHTKYPLKCKCILITPHRSVNGSCYLKCKRILFTPHRSVNTSHLLTRGRNKLNMFPVNSNFLVRRMRELTHGKSMSLAPPASLMISLS